MITPDDRRHGSYAGYKAGCDCDDCTEATYRYCKGLHIDHERGTYRTCEARGTARRVHALQAIGWPLTTIAARAGLSSERAVWKIANSQAFIFTSSRDAIARVYDELCMTPAVDKLANRRRSLAAKKGYAPPLAWDDIDQDEAPADAPRVAQTSDEFIDENAVQRALDGDRTVALTKAERKAVVERALSLQIPLQEVARRTGLQPHRYIEHEEEAA